MPSNFLNVAQWVSGIAGIWTDCYAMYKEMKWWNKIKKWESKEFFLLRRGKERVLLMRGCISNGSSQNLVSMQTLHLIVLAYQYCPWNCSHYPDTKSATWTRIHSDFSFSKKPKSWRHFHFTGQVVPFRLMFALVVVDIECYNDSLLALKIL